MTSIAPWFLLAHGAGAGSDSAWMVRWRGYLETLGEVVVFDYPYVQAGRRRPDPLPRLLEAHARALEEARTSRRGAPVLVGKSLGGRVGCHLALERSVGAIVCLGYPLVSPSARRAQAQGRPPPPLRDRVLLELTTPILFVQGTRDPLCPLEELERTSARMRAPHELHVVPTGDHSHIATKTHLAAQGITQETLDRAALGSIRSFLARHLDAGAADR